MRNLKFTSIILFFSILLISCGGSGGDESNNSGNGGGNEPRAINLGFNLGIGGVVTFKNGGSLG